VFWDAHCKFHCPQTKVFVWRTISAAQPFSPGLNISDQEAIQQTMVKKDEGARKLLEVTEMGEGASKYFVL
jgi:hypothetical protein